MRLALSLFILTTLLSLTTSTMLPQVYPNPWYPKTYKLQMNDPPKEAWAHIVKDYDKEIQVVYKVFKYISWIDPEHIREIGELGKQWKAFPEVTETAAAIAELAHVPYDILFFL